MYATIITIISRGRIAATTTTTTTTTTATAVAATAIAITITMTVPDLGQKRDNTRNDINNDVSAI